MKNNVVKEKSFVFALRMALLHKYPETLAVKSFIINLRMESLFVEVGSRE